MKKEPGSPVLFSLCIYYKVRSEVQWGQRVASIAISDLQWGQIFVVGAAGTSICFLKWSLLIDLIMRNRTRAIKRKLMTAEIKEP